MIQITEVPASYDIYIDFEMLRRNQRINGAKQRFVAEKLVEFFTGEQGLTVVEGSGANVTVSDRVTF